MDEDNTNNPKVSGYLEKKSKMKMMNSYKRYWFVLEGRLLLYYRSKDEYEAISPCKGSINLGPPCNVKPCPSTGGVYIFQIETRTTTITLRADKREDQNRWMQGIMSALNQNINATKLSHFRYSLDELSHQTHNKNFLKRKNTIPLHPHSSKIELSKEKGIIQRLQKIGVLTYGGSISAIDQMANKCQNENISNLQEIKHDDTLLVENEQYGMINENIDVENVDVRKKPHHSENIYERISADCSISTSSKQVSCSHHNNSNINKTEICERRKCNAGKNEKQCRPTTLLLENETYEGIPLNSIQNDTENKIRQTSFVLENNHYYSVDKIIKFPNTDSEVIYAEPNCSEVTDHNENNMLLNKIIREENAYSITKLYDYKNNTTQSEDLEIYINNTEAKSEIQNDKIKPTFKKNKSKKQFKDNVDKDKKDFKLKKSSSFIKRVWKKRMKHKEKEENIEELYETVPDSVVEKVALTDETAVQILSELQNILENKKPILLEQCSKPYGDASDNEDVSRTSTNENAYFSMDNTATSQVLSELQNRFKDKKILTPESSTEHHTTAKSPTWNENQNTNPGKSTTNIPYCDSQSEVWPPLPLKHHESFIPSPYHDEPKNNQPVYKILPPKKKQNDSMRSLDEILDDLETEKTENSNKFKVKTLIKQFNVADTEDVELRTNNKIPDFPKEDIDSSELYRLLDELAKVTCAPILTPGVTSSLISPILTDEELIKLLPTHRRQHSEPDYDIPRPHKSLINLPRDESSPENIIGSTRFFGPILKTDIYTKKHETSPEDREDLPQLLSMTPDSLEPELVQNVKYTPIPCLWEDDKCSYSSHHYIQLKHNANKNKTDDFITKKNMSTHFESSVKCLDDIMISNDIYVQPKSLHNLELIKKFNYNNNNNNNLVLTSELVDENLDDNIFIDSLEISDN